MTLPTSTTNMTGFLATRRGSSLRKASTEARCMILGSNSDFGAFFGRRLPPEPPAGAGVGRGGGAVCSCVAMDIYLHPPFSLPLPRGGLGWGLEQTFLKHLQVLDDGTQRNGREEGQAPTMMITPISRTVNT